MSSTFYDRTSNISIAAGNKLTAITYAPIIGSRVSFNARASLHETQNGYYNMIPMSVNSVDAKFDLKFELDLSGTQKLVNFIEEKEGHILFAFADSSSFYKTMSGVCDNYAVNHINTRHYEVGMSFEVNQAPMILNWSGMSFLNKTAIPWASGASYSKYDIVYSGVNPNKLNNYYYCTATHSSSLPSIDGPTGSTSKWTQSFFFEPDVGIQNDVALKVDKIEFKNSFIQRMKTRKHLSQTNFSYKFAGVTTREAVAIMHFLENKAGYRRFFHDPPSIYNKTKVFYAPSWTHAWGHLDSHDIEVTLIEDPLGVVPKGT